MLSLTLVLAVQFNGAYVTDADQLPIDALASSIWKLDFSGGLRVLSTAWITDEFSLAKLSVTLGPSPGEGCGVGLGVGLGDGKGEGVGGG